MPLADRKLYPEDAFPFGAVGLPSLLSGDFERASAGFAADVRATVRVLFRAGNPALRGKPSRTAFVRANGGWFGRENKAPPVPRDERVIREEDERAYVEALERNGFAGPDSWYVNPDANAAYAKRARANWRLGMPISSCTRLTTMCAKRSTRASPSRCAPIAPI